MKASTIMNDAAVVNPKYRHLMIGADTLRRCGAIVSYGEERVRGRQRDQRWRVHGGADVSLVAHFVGRASVQPNANRTG